MTASISLTVWSWAAFAAYLVALAAVLAIIVNNHDEIHDGEKCAYLINGTFMECDPEPGKLCGRERMGRALRSCASAFRSPRVNALEGWGDRRDFKRMRPVTALGLTQPDAYVL
jgi:hypothetical protein